MSLADRLTPRQLDIARCIADGLTLQETAAALGISIYTVRQRCYDGDSLYGRLGARSMVDIARAVYEDAMSNATEHPKEWEDDWTFRPAKAHWTREPLPAGDAWTDYSDGERMLTRGCTDHRAHKVTVRGPIGADQRVSIRKIDGTHDDWEAAPA